MSYLSQLQVADDGNFQYKVMVAAVLTAREVMAELAVVTGHAKRTDLAYRVLQDPDDYRRRFTYAIVTNTAISLSSTDAAIKAEVVLAWDAMAGVIL